ncbi:hypothetical protein GCM10011316_38580 [Roseibium aquae]|uniref:DNA primase/polymerase bifunctional N-terminal domain-containing protein n=1 Tax=Roseibium aquae TaxID=1323746 RepID=A0A916TNM6_9HYPH|nr:bifunctional DNA primase/polymerase [Roseibium aquae]GGB62970.1 hypothetical protein GCM10011316_38580 [Roseibium aquae]
MNQETEKAGAANSGLLINQNHWGDVGIFTPENDIQNGAIDQAKIQAFSQELLAMALYTASHGKPVFPCRSDKRPYLKNGFKGATTDPDQIRAWWTQWPLAMIGMPTGAVSQLIVLDVDRKNGVDGLANLRAVGIDPFALTHVVSRTPSGGLHFFMRHTGKPVKNSVGVLAKGVDVRGDGGYVVLPPSRPFFTGPDYAWEVSHG